MTYIVSYETENFTRLSTIGHGGLTSFKKLVKSVGWNLNKIDVVDRTGRVIRTEKYENNKLAAVFER